MYVNKPRSVLCCCLQDDGINDQIRVNQLYSPLGMQALERKAWHSLHINKQGLLMNVCRFKWHVQQPKQATVLSFQAEIQKI